MCAVPLVWPPSKLRGAGPFAAACGCALPAPPRATWQSTYISGSRAPTHPPTRCGMGAPGALRQAAAPGPPAATACCCPPHPRRAVRTACLMCRPWSVRAWTPCLPIREVPQWRSTRRSPAPTPFATSCADMSRCGALRGLAGPMALPEGCWGVAWEEPPIGRSKRDGGRGRDAQLGCACAREQQQRLQQQCRRGLCGAPTAAAHRLPPTGPPRCRPAGRDLCG